MQGVVQLTTGFSNKYECDINQSMCFLQLFLLISKKNQTVQRLVCFRDSCLSICVSSLDINNSVFLRFNEFIWFEC